MVNVVIKSSRWPRSSFVGLQRASRKSSWKVGDVDRKLGKAHKVSRTSVGKLEMLIREANFAPGRGL